MLKLFQHLIESTSYETLKRVQGDKKRIVTQSLTGEGWGEGGDINLLPLPFIPSPAFAEAASRRQAPREGEPLEIGGIIGQVKREDSID